VALARENGGQTCPPNLLHIGQDAKLVVHQDVVMGRIVLLDVVQFPLLVDVDEDAAFYRLEQSLALDLVRLEDHVAIG
jgi:hypothetical protein